MIRSTISAVLLLLFLVLCTSGAYLVITSYGNSYSFSINNLLSPPQSQTTHAADTSKDMVPLQEVHNLGYDFYVGQIDSVGTNNITDDLKNQITKIAYTARFPATLLKKIPIIILNNLALTGHQYIPTISGNLNVPDFKPDFLSEGGVYASFQGGGAVIFINKPIISQGQLTNVLTHELGHAIGSTLSATDWKKYYQLRNIPAGTPQEVGSWNLSPAEDFAEVYKSTFTGLAIQTYYGQLILNLFATDMGACQQIYQKTYNSLLPQIDVNDTKAWMDSIIHPTKIDYTAISSEADSDPKVQSCRRNVMGNPSKYPSEWEYGVPYKSTEGPQTKAFINSLMGKLN